MLNWNWRNKWLWISLALHLPAVIFSVGYYHWDEHFQILEFAGLKLGRTPAEALNWEFREQIRPWLQPAIYTGIARVAEAIGIHSASSFALLFRLFSSLFGWVTVAALMQTSSRWIRSEKMLHAAIIALSLFWFFPFFHARTASENLASSFFFLGICVLAQPTLHRLGPLLAGFLLGLSFESRYQVAFMILPTMAWLVLVGKYSWRSIAEVSLGGLIALAACTGIDRWGYGEWAFAPYNYFHANLVRGAVNEFGVNPWWDYVRQVWVTATPPLGAVILAACAAMWIMRPLHLLTWCTLPFVLVHMAIGHKEMRFLYPIAPAIALFPFIALDTLDRSCARWLESKPARAGLRIFLALNAVALVIGMFSATRNPFRYIEYVSRNYTDGIELYSFDRDPLRDVSYIYFYRPENYSYHQIPESEFKRVLEEKKSIRFFATVAQLPSVASPYCEAEFTSVPGWLKAVNFNGWYERIGNWTLFRCDAKRLFQN